MQIPTRTIALGLLIACAATPVRAQPKAPETKPPVIAAGVVQSTPIDLALRPVATPQPALIDLALRPVATPQPALIDPALRPMATPPSNPADLSLQSASEEVKRVVRWITDSGDNDGMPYLLIDKVNAQVFAFNRAGQLQGAAPVLLGMARGDRMLAPNDAPMSAMPPQVRITPAGRFVSRLAKDSKGKELLVMDYDASLSLHPVVKGTPAERRAERLKSVTVQDNRVSFGCINAPVPFYQTIVSPAFTGTKGIVYVLPETAPASQLFGFQPVDAAVAGAQQGSTALDAPAAQPVPAPVAK